MDKNYIKALNIAEYTLDRISSIYGSAKTETFEEIKGCKSLEKLIEDLEDFIRTIQHYSKDTEQGYLQLNSNSRYELNGTELSCGYPIELWNSKYQEWEDGRIEHSSKYGEYYFYNYDGEHIVLNDGIKARVRV